ncbi:hypothetical protein tpqmel_0437 [Candidatus Gastranaerophilus sp. (ex Termes propinquus)]|nr:hypothetical protein tpqmel_0437 [Candidatus Gastranaerophilus sp. (ex Termes propinquus)]
MTNHQNNIVRVKAYVKDDGTKVREHYRGIVSSGVRGRSIVEEPSEGGYKKE